MASRACAAAENLEQRRLQIMRTHWNVAPYEPVPLGKRIMAGRKVYQAHLGFYDTVVAAPSQASALAAWGSRQNLFREGLARVSDDPDAIRAALAQPGVVLRRPAGSNVPYSLNPPLPKLATRKKTKKTTAKGKKR